MIPLGNIRKGHDEGSGNIRYGYRTLRRRVGRDGTAQLPESSDGATRARLRRKAPGAEEASPQSPSVSLAIEAMVALLSGERSDLSFIAVDMTHVSPFNRSVYEIARTIAPGETRTYGEIATRLGDKLLSRAVGQALGENPFPIVVPCHRVLAANGKTGGFSANGGVTTKFRILAIERARVAGHRPSDAPMLFEPELSIAPRQQRR
jgi:methylated-DNA-[protein]-cysteine S-methyltransferase